MQARQFLAKLEQKPDIRVKTALVLLLFTGVRRGELCGLEWPDIDIKKRIVNVERASQYQAHRGVVEVPTKNASSVRAIKVPAAVIDLLRQYRAWWNEHRLLFGKAWGGSQERLFVQDDGKPINPDTINFWLERFITKNGLPHITPHGLRHTFATLQITAGVDVRTLQARTGHAQASTSSYLFARNQKRTGGRQRRSGKRLAARRKINRTGQGKNRSLKWEAAFFFPDLPYFFRPYLNKS